MRSIRHGKGREPSFGRSVVLYAGFLLALAAIAMFSAIAGDPPAMHSVQSAMAAQAIQAGPRDAARAESARDDPSLPSAADVLSTPATAAPVESVAPTF
jgi:hypothetical protein